MTKSMLAGRVVVLVALGVQPAAAQPAEPGGARGPVAPVRLADEIALMEVALSHAVNRGAQTVEQRFSGSFPGLVLFAGHTQVRGFRLADYGVFFDVEYPVLRQSIVWSMQMLESDFETGLRIVGRVLSELEEGAQRPDRSRVGFGAPDASEPRRSDAAGDASGTAPEAGSARSPVDPQSLYMRALEDGLVEAVLRHGGSLAAVLDGEDWLYVTARDVRGLRGRDTTLRLRWDGAVRPQDCAFRIRAADLNALHEGHLTLEEARARISVQPF